MKLQPFTVIGATTRSGMLTAPLRDRFVNRQHLDFYEVDDLREIVIRNAKKLRSDITTEAGTDIAIRSRSTPRKANNLLLWARDYAEAKHDGNITTDNVKAAFEMLEIDELGLEEQDRKYLRTLYTVFAGGPAGIQAIAHTMNISPDTLEDEVEPFLLRIGFMQRTPRGRMITTAAMEHLGLETGSGKPQNQLF